MQSDQTAATTRPQSRQRQQQVKVQRRTAQVNSPEYQAEQRRKAMMEANQRSQASLSQGTTGYDPLRAQREALSQQMLETERQIKQQEEGKQEAAAFFNFITQPLMAHRYVGAAFNPNNHTTSDYVYDFFSGNNKGFAEISDATRKWAERNPEVNEAVNFAGDLITPWALSKGWQFGRGAT